MGVEGRDLAPPRADEGRRQKFGDYLNFQATFFTPVGRALFRRA